MQTPWKVILAFAGVFAAGGVCGGFVALRVDKAVRPPAGRTQVWQSYWSQTLKRLHDNLALTEEQTRQIRPIVERSQEQVAGLRKENFLAVGRAMERMHTEIAELLTPEQKAKFEDMRRKLRERLERERAERRANPPRN